MSVAMKQYAQYGAQGAVQDATPHRLIQMLYHGALDRMTEAKGAMSRGDCEQKGRLIGKAIAIVGGLRDALDQEGADIAKNLDALYGYLAGRLLEASFGNDEALLEECIGLLAPVSDAWDQIEGLVEKSAANL